MSSISVTSGTPPQPEIAVRLLPDGTAAPAHVLITRDGQSAVPITETTALAFAAATAAFVALLTPQPITPQSGPLLFGFPL